MSVRIIDPHGLAGGDLTLPDRETALRAIASMPRSYGLYIQAEPETTGDADENREVTR